MISCTGLTFLSLYINRRPLGWLLLDGASMVHYGLGSRLESYGHTFYRVLTKYSCYVGHFYTQFHHFLDFLYSFVIVLVNSQCCWKKRGKIQKSYALLNFITSRLACQITALLRWYRHDWASCAAKEVPDITGIEIQSQFPGGVA